MNFKLKKYSFSRYNIGFKGIVKGFYVSIGFYTLTILF